MRRTKTQRCRYCNARIPEGAYYCPNCGQSTSIWGKWRPRSALR